MKIQTRLISGAGNTFHVAYDPKDFSGWTPAQRKALTVRACRENPADGFIFLEDAAPGSYRWYFYNNDGSDAEMCGNATRCVGFFVKNILHSPLKQWSLATVAGNVSIETAQEQFRVVMTPVLVLRSSLGFFCDTGVPHLVLERGSLDLSESSKTEAARLRNHPEFTRGTNVTYVVLEKETNKVKAVSYERGVEDFTAACGTGAMAAALYNLTKRAAPETQVEMPGGTLMMNLSNLQKPVMTGPAVLMGSYEYEISN